MRLEGTINNISITQRTTKPFLLSQHRRLAHAVPRIREEAEDEKLKAEGIPGLFSPGAYNVAWTEYQQFMVDRLNTILASKSKTPLTDSHG